VAAKESYNDLIFELGDLARERLAEKPNTPRSMDRVFKAEDVVLAQRDELKGLEEQLNEEDASFNDFLEAQEAEREEQKEIVKKWRAAVAGLEVRSRDLRKKISTAKATLRYERVNQKRAEERHKELELRESHDERKVSLSRELIKKTRLQLMRKQRNIEDMEHEFETLLTPRPGQPGAQGILAHKRLLEMEDEAETRKADHEVRMQELDQQIAAKEEEVQAAEDYLDQAVFLLGEEVYGARINDPVLAPMYLRLDKAS
jgi:DNA repair exonuclease SbcCD ATPase subunit